MSLVAERPGVVGRKTSRTRPLRRLLATLAVCGAAVGLFACYLRLSATFAVGSDGASNALEAWDLLHGNWLLRGWTLTDVSFYTTELPEYAAVELARGLNPDVVHTAAAVTYTLLVLAAAFLARGRARGWEGLVRALIAAGVMVAPQLGNGIHVLLSQPDHVGTQVPLLGAFLLLDRAPRRWYTVAAIWALLAAATVADKIVIVDAAVPLAFVCLLHAIWASTPRTGWRAAEGPREPASRGLWGGARLVVAARVRAQWFELSVAAAAAASAGTAQLLMVGISRLGGFTMLPVETGMVTPGGVPGHLAMALHDTLNLFGADITAAQPGPQSVFAWLHAPGVALAVAAFAVAAWRVPCQRDLISDVLAVGIVVNLAGFIASIIPASPFDTRELAAVLPFGAVLAGRVLGPQIAQTRFTTATLAVAGVCQLAALGYGASRPPAVNPEQALAGWLGAHHLTSGLAVFTDGNVTTLDSGGAVRLAAVSWGPAYSGVPASSAPRRYGPGITGFGGGALGEPAAAVPRLYQSSASWYDPRAEYANFVVTGTADGPADLIPSAEIIALAGQPASTYQFGSFTIMVWDQNLLALLGAPPSHLPGDIGHP